MRVVLVLGQAQQGKTTLALKHLRARVPRLLILDPVASTPFRELADNRFTSWTGLRQFLVSDRAKGNWIAVLSSGNDMDHAQALEAAPFLRHVTILADEGLWMTSSKEVYPFLLRTSRANAHYGQGIGVPLWITAQRPTDLPPDVRSQATTVISFRQDEPGDLDFLAKRCTTEFAERVRNLELHSYRVWPDSDAKLLAEV